MRIHAHLLSAAAAIGVAFGGSVAHAAAITVEASSVGDLVLTATDTSTAGSAANPWTIDETYIDHGHLQFSSDQTSGALGDSNPTGTGHDAGKWISKSVTNNSGVVWTSFEFELQVLLGTASSNGDGLSFADGSTLTSLFNSDRFSQYTRQDVTRDYLNFSGGSVGIGETVTFNFVITDNVANDPFYLLETANKQDIPEPSSLGLLAVAIGGLALSRRRRR